MNDSVVMLGGPDHGKRFTVPPPSTFLNFVEMPYKTFSFDPKEPLAGIEMPAHESRHIIEITLGAHRARAVIYYPQISQDVGRLMLGDMVYAAWEKYELGHNFKERMYG